MNDFWSQFVETFLKIWHYPLFQMGSTPFEPSTIFIFLILTMVVLITGRCFRQWVVARLLQQTTLHPSLQYSIAKIIHYIFVTIGLFISLQIVGIGLNSITVLLGAIGVGIGFGLQNIVNNFVSGLIILIERPINMGDRIEIGSVAGRVTRIGARSTTVNTNDNIAIIVPNANLITETVINWSHGDTRVRFRLPITVAYGSDLEKLEKILLQVGDENPHALKDPPPRLYFNSFGENGLKFELAVWTSEMSFNPRRFRSDLNFAIEKTLRKHQFIMPFPQRDLHLRTADCEWKK